MEAVASGRRGRSVESFIFAWVIGVGSDENACLMVIYLFTMLVKKLGGTSEAVVILLGHQSSSQLPGWHHISATRRARYIGIV